MCHLKPSSLMKQYSKINTRLSALAQTSTHRISHFIFFWRHSKPSFYWNYIESAPKPDPVSTSFLLRQGQDTVQHLVLPILDATEQDFRCTCQQKLTVQSPPRPRPGSRTHRSTSGHTDTAHQWQMVHKNMLTGRLGKNAMHLELMLYTTPFLIII